MKNIELRKLLEEFPDDMEVWVSDNGYCEGGERLQKVQKVLAYSAGLDGDEVDDEWVYIEEDTKVKELLEGGYQKVGEDVLSKEIIYLNNL